MSRYREDASLPRPAREYLDELTGELGDLPTTRRREIVADIAANIVGELDAAGASGAGEFSGDGIAAAGRSPDTVLGILDRLGPPAEIARSARSELPTAQPRMAGGDITAVVLLLAGGFALLVGWLIGLALLWTSPAWRLRDKIIGTVLVPGGLATPFLLGGIPTGSSVSVCTVPTGSDPAAAGCAVENTNVLPAAVTIAILLVTVAGPIFTTIWLSIHAVRVVPVAAHGNTAQASVSTVMAVANRSPSHRFRPSVTTAVLLAVGVGLIAAHGVLDWLNVGGIGAPTDIGGGLILLVGYILTGMGLVKGAVEFARRNQVPRQRP